MIPSTTALSDTLFNIDRTISNAESLIQIGQRDAAVSLITDTSDDFVGVLSQFGPEYFSNEEIEKIQAYEMILRICAEFASTQNNEYDDDEGEAVYDW